MQTFLLFVRRVSRFTNWVGGVILVLMMLLTVVDVVLRYLGKGFTGTFELMSFGGALVVGFAIAQTSLDNGHVNVDILTQGLGVRAGRICLVVTKLIGITMFLLLAWSFFMKGNELFAAGEVSLTLHVPFYPVAYGLGLCSIVECLVLLCDILKSVTGVKS
jgi:TRAP-type C4-dicarboxylate transport system permease small subunit